MVYGWFYLAWWVRSGRQTIHTEPTSWGLYSIVSHIPTCTFPHPHLVNKRSSSQWWCAPLIPALRRQRQVNLCEFEASLVYRTSSRTAKTVTQRNPVSKERRERKKERWPINVSSNINQKCPVGCTLSQVYMAHSLGQGTTPGPLHLPASKQT